MLSKERKSLIKNLYCEKKAAISRLPEGPWGLVLTLIAPQDILYASHIGKNGHRIHDHGKWHR